jgi:hypothetical protein
MSELEIPDSDPDEPTPDEPTTPDEEEDESVVPEE